MAKQASIFSFFNRSATTPKAENSPKTFKLNGSPVEEFTLVWGKLEGHPWWPGLVCKPPSGDSFVRKKTIHLQFFENPPSRGWVRESFIKAYGDPIKVGIPVRKDSAWRTAQALADDAAKQSVEDRRQLLVDHLLSDEEMEEEGNSSKENIDDSNVSSPGGGKKRTNSSDGGGDAPDKKRRRIVLKSDSEESGDEYKPDKEASSSNDSASSGEDEANISEPDTSHIEEDSPSPVQKSKAPHKTPATSNGRSTPAPYTPTAPPFTPYTPTAPKYTPKISSAGASPAVRSKLALFAAKESSEGGVDEEGGPSYTKLAFLQPENIRDGEGRKMAHPDYDCRTLRVPDDFMSQQTPGHRQWWDFKSKHFDTVLYFKMGKFYELFYMDAEIGVQELGLLLMKGNPSVPHSGFPEISYGRYSASLIEKGYKVARIEQTETPDMMEKRCKAMTRATKFDRVVRREVCQLSSAGTRVYGPQDAEPTAPEPAYLIALTAKSIEDCSGSVTTFGVCFLDTSLGVFHLGQFSDDRHHSRLRTLLAHYPPVQILTERNRLAGGVRSLLSQYASGHLLEALAPEAEFWTASKTLEFLAEDASFRDGEGRLDWPQGLRGLMEEGSLSPVENSSELSLSALGAVVWYLRRSFIHSQLLSARHFMLYVPPDCQNSSTDQAEEGVKKTRFRQRTMVIDGGSAINLELLRNESTGEAAGSLYGVLDHTCTPMGKRLLQQWVSAPLISSGSINSRLDAVTDLRDNGALVEDAAAVLAALPDIDRLLPRIHSHGLQFSASDPNSRAILYEEQQYGRKRVTALLMAIQAFTVATKLPDVFKGAELSSSLLRSIVSSTEDGGKFPLMKDTLQFFKEAFNHETAKKEGKMIPSSGVDEQYDSALNTIDETKTLLDQYLKEQCQYFGAKVVYFGRDKNRYQLEVPDSASKKAKSQYEFTGQRKGFKRFWTPRCKELLAQMAAADECRETALKDIARRIFKQFDDKQELWSGCMQCVSVLDVLLSLTKYSNTADTARPEIVEQDEGDEAFLEIRDGVHPCIGMSRDEIIANDVVLGGGGGAGAHSPLVLVTGPNMGGKSTLMRQTALLAIIAQMGCYVPCSAMRLSPVDRIFTRVGASDRMMAGESTFLVELRETAAILQHATEHALVLVDELGRGTATHDGTAVAWGVAGALVERRCRTLFSTHYHGLVHHFANTPGVSMGHMACMVEGEDDAESGGEESITFLYKFCPGVCPKSYGFNAARLAEVPQAVVAAARRAARHLEGRSDALLSFRKLMGGGCSSQEKRDVIRGLAPILKAIAS